MGRFGMQIAPAQVTLLSVVVATNPTPRLTVRSIQPWGSQRMMARLECESKEQCLPFFVGLQMGNGSDAQGGGQSIVVPNGNGTSTIIHPNGTVETVPTPKP